MLPTQAEGIAWVVRQPTRRRDGPSTLDRGFLRHAAALPRGRLSGRRRPALRAARSHTPEGTHEGPDRVGLALVALARHVVRVQDSDERLLRIEDPLPLG